MIIGTGTTITWNGAIAELLDVTPPGLSRESVPTSHMGTIDAHTFLPTTLYDPGELTIEMAFLPSYASAFLETVGTAVITFPNSGSTTWTFEAFVTGYEPADPLEDRMTATLTLKVTGEITIG